MDGATPPSSISPAHWSRMCGQYQRSGPALLLSAQPWRNTVHFLAATQWPGTVGNLRGMGETGHFRSGSAEEQAEDAAVVLSYLYEATPPDAWYACERLSDASLASSCVRSAIKRNACDSSRKMPPARHDDWKHAVSYS